MAPPIEPSHEERVAKYRISAVEHARGQVTRDLEDAMEASDSRIKPHWDQIVEEIIKSGQQKKSIVDAFEEFAGPALAGGVNNFDLKTMMPSSFWGIFRWTQKHKDLIDVQMAELETERHELEMAKLQAEREKSLQHARSLCSGTAQALPSPASETMQAFSPAAAESARELSPSASLINILTLAGTSTRTAGNPVCSEAIHETAIYDPESLPTLNMPQTMKRGVSSDGELSSSSKRTRTEPPLPLIRPLSPIITSDISREQAVSATAPVVVAPLIEVKNDPVSTWEVEASEFVFEYPLAGEGWFVIRCNMGPDAKAPPIGGPGGGGFVTHPFEGGTALSHFKFTDVCRGHHFALYDEKEIIRDHGHRVIGPDLDEDWVSTSNHKLASEVAQKQKAASPSKKVKQLKLGAATRTSTSPNAAKIKQRMKKHGGGATRW